MSLSSAFHQPLTLLQHPLSLLFPLHPLIPAPHQSSQALPSPKILWLPLWGVSGWASYLRIEADLTDVTGNDRPLGLEQGSPKSVGEHSLLHRVHLWRQAGVSQEPQHRFMSITPALAAAGFNQSPQSLFPTPQCTCGLWASVP